MRKLEEILSVNTEPFDEDILKDVYYEGYYNSPRMLDSFAVLIFLYYKKFDEQYGTSLAVGIDMEQVLAEAAYDDENFLWRENIVSVIYETLCESGWNIHWLTDCLEGFSAVKEKSGDSDEEFHKAYKEFLNDLYKNCFVKSCLLKEEEEIRDAGWLEESLVGLLWNDDYDRYKQYKKKNKQVIETICPKEDMGICILEEEVWNPYVMWYSQKTGIHRGKKYSLIVLGCDGYNYCSYEDINPNWIFRILKMGWLLQSALEKIDCYEKEKQGKEAA